MRTPEDEAFEVDEIPQPLVGHHPVDDVGKGASQFASHQAHAQQGRPKSRQ